MPVRAPNTVLLPLSANPTNPIFMGREPYNTGAGRGQPASASWRILRIHLRRRNLFGPVWRAIPMDSLAASRDSMNGIALLAIFQRLHAQPG